MKNKVNKGLHWTTIISEKALLAVIGILAIIGALQYVQGMWVEKAVNLADLFMLFIYAEIIGMVGAFYSTSRIPVTLPIIISLTALCRLVILHSKDMEPLTLIAEAAAILILACSAYIMSAKDKISLEKLRNVSENKDRS